MIRHLIQPRELYGTEQRQLELATCWQANDLLFDEVTAPDGRPTFAEMFAMCKTDAMNVIANSDIYFDWTLPSDIMPGHVYALSRWDADTDNRPRPYHKADSQDAWIVYGGPHTVDAPFPMGVPGCDNAIAHILEEAGFEVTNPCLSIRAIHLHSSGYRTYGEGRGKPKMYRVPPPYKLVYPCGL